MGKFSFTHMDIPGLVVIEPTLFGDDRGYFLETYTARDFAEVGIAAPFVQDNESKSRRGVLRGLHFQKEHTQGKLVRVLSGSVYDVAVDLRPNSPAFGKWAGVELSAANNRMFYVPEGFGHGFLVLSDEAVFSYKCTDYYAPKAEGGVRFDDAGLAVAWPGAGAEYALSPKDLALPAFAGQDFSYFERWYRP